jgi:DNA phosphorothioation-dependent restriction protein DptH
MYHNYYCHVQEGALVIADLTDPMLAPEEANGIFQVLLEQFRRVEHPAKLAVFDEAHKYMSANTKYSKVRGLGNEMVSVFRQMRHLGMRMVVSTQSPAVLPPEMLELATVAVVHGFHSKDWFRLLQSKTDISDDMFPPIQALQTGEAMVYARKSDITQDGTDCWHMMTIRQRLTKDGGCSVREHFDNDDE